MTRVLPLLLLGACSEYSITEKKAPELGAEDTAIDTAPPVDTAPPACPDQTPDGYAVAVTETCATEPEVGSFDPVLEWQWDTNPVHAGYHQIMAQPVVANLTDDDGDGDIDADDTPDIVFSAFGPTNYREPGVLVAISGADGATLWSTTGDGTVQPYGTSGVAIADLDGSGPSVFAVTTGGVTRFDKDGAVVWTASLPSMPSYGQGHVAVADMEGDGVAEVVFGPHVIEADGSVRWSGGAGTGRFTSIPVDLDLDGRLEVVAGGTVYDNDGTTRWTTSLDGNAAVADLDVDGAPEIIVSDNGGGRLVALNADGTERWTYTFTDRGGGPPTVADYDGDGYPEVGLASEQVYRVLEHDGSLKWSNPVQDASSQRTGSSVFDFEGDGAAEVVYADEETLWVYDGATGTVEMAWSSHSSGTLVEYPVIVDVDGDGAAEIVAAANDYSRHNDTHGIVVVGDASGSWSPARPIWNQHAYSITHITDAGRVPASHAPSWSSVNSFRAGNSETRTGLDLPDLQLGEPAFCLDECGMDRVLAHISVENAATADVSGVVDVAFYRWEGGSRELLRTETTVSVGSGAQRWIGPLELAPDDFGSAGLLIRVDDDGTGTGAWDECDEADNTLAIEAWPCP